jgi:alanine racemase
MHLFLRCILLMISSSGILTVNLSSIQSNWLHVAALLKQGAECAAVVKADAYSVGAVKVAEALYAVGCQTFYVVTLEEATELRNVLPDDAILYVLGGVREGSEASFTDLGLIPVLYSFAAIDQWLKLCVLHQQAFPCALKFDTGMTRSGLTNSEFDRVLNLKSSLLNPVLFMSHLACADVPGHPLNEQQLKRFDSAVLKIKSFFPAVKTSLANSSGSFLGEEYHFDMVRIGAALYGINPQPTLNNPLLPVLDLQLPVLQIRTTEVVSSVGYGAEASIGPNMRLAVVAGGYADGVHRTLGLAPVGRVGGVTVGSIGRVSMDSCIFNITQISGNPEYISVIDEQQTLDVLMNAKSTLGYEVLTSLGRRYQRRYIFSGNEQ